MAYDPERISYEALLKTFWEHHDPTQGMRQGNDVGTQYRSIIVADERAAADRRGLEGDVSRQMLSKAGYAEIRTEIVDASSTRSTTPRTTTSSTSTRTRAATARTTRPA